MGEIFFYYDSFLKMGNFHNQVKQRKHLSEQFNKITRNIFNQHLKTRIAREENYLFVLLKVI